MLRSVIFIFLFLIAGATGAQQKLTTYHTNAYILDLPPTWMKPKTIRAISEILQETIDELKDRNFYSTGTADYHVKLYIDSLEVINEVYMSAKHSFSYRFYAGLGIYDSLNHPVSMLRLFSREVWHDYSRNYGTPAPSMIASYDSNVYDTAGVIVGQRPLPVIAETDAPRPPRNSIDVIYNELVVEKCEKKLFEIRKYLRRRGPL